MTPMGPPEVERRELYRKYKFSTVYEFASKLAGMSHDICKRVLYLGERFREMPEIWEQIRVHGWTKLQTIVGVIDEDNKKIWIDNLNRCTRAGLRELVRVFKEGRAEQVGKIEDGGRSGRCDESDGCGENEQGDDVGVQRQMLVAGYEGPSHFSNDGSEHQVSARKMDVFKFKVDDDTKFKFKKLKRKLEKEKGALTMGETLKLLIEKLERQDKKIVKRKSKKAGNGFCSNEGKKVRRYIPVAERREVEEQQNGRCIAKDCNEPIQQFHHTDRFSITKSHENLVGVCNMHHQLAHLGFVEEMAGNWKVHWRRQSLGEAIERVDGRFEEFYLLNGWLG